MSRLSFSPVSAITDVPKSPADDSSAGPAGGGTPRRKLCLDDSLQSPSTLDSAYGTSSSLSEFSFGVSSTGNSIDRRHSLAIAYSDKENVCPYESKQRPVSFSSFPLSSLSSNIPASLASKPLIKQISSPLERMALVSPDSSSDGYFSDVFGEETSQEFPKSFSNLFAAPITSTCTNSKSQSPVSRRTSVKRTLMDNDERESKKVPLCPSSPVPPHKPLKGVSLFRSQSVCVPPPPCENAMFPDSPGDGGVEMIGDHSKPYLLPLTQGTVPDLKCITPDTVTELLKGQYQTEYLIVDCRYPYEYEGGHIQGAVNIWDKDVLLEKFFSTPTYPCPDKRYILVFHCEFSSKRAPEMSRFMRKTDRERNGMDFPKLFYPELYLIEGGYKNFFQCHPDFCSPCNYRCMHDNKHKAEFLHFAKRSKSWSGGNNPAGRRLRQRHSIHDIH